MLVSKPKLNNMGGKESYLSICHLSTPPFIYLFIYSFKANSSVKNIDLFQSRCDFNTVLAFLSRVWERASDALFDFIIESLGF